MYKETDFLGVKLGKLTVVEFSHKNRGFTYWKARCDCGKMITIRNDRIRHKITKSCGCDKYKYGCSIKGDLTYKSWSHMLYRCHKITPDNPDYKDYMGRGIKVCPEWFDYNVFLKEMGHRQKGQSIDRIDTNGDYNKSNCRWASAKQQSQNKRNNINISYKGETLCAKEWGIRFNVCQDTVISSIKRFGLEKAFIIS
jgi:hypothetical protein